jgi:hypothetical protein
VVKVARARGRTAYNVSGRSTNDSHRADFFSVNRDAGWLPILACAADFVADAPSPHPQQQVNGDSGVGEPLRVSRQTLQRLLGTNADGRGGVVATDELVVQALQ